MAFSASELLAFGQPPRPITSSTNHWHTWEPLSFGDGTRCERHGCRQRAAAQVTCAECLSYPDRLPVGARHLCLAHNASAALHLPASTLSAFNPRTTPPAALLGTRVSIQWSRGTFYDGVVDQYRQSGSNNEWHCTYDDGDTRYIHKRADRFSTQRALNLSSCFTRMSNSSQVGTTRRKDFPHPDLSISIRPVVAGVVGRSAFRCRSPVCSIRRVPSGV